MQTAVPELFRFQDESSATQKLYGMDREITKPFGQDLLTARRLVERGVPFVQVFHGYREDGNGWDAHSELKKNHSRLCAEIDLPLAGLLRDLRQRGLFKETLVVVGSEFGRTPGVEGNREGRDHHPFGFSFGFSVVMAGGGLKRGMAPALPMSSASVPLSPATTSRTFTPPSSISSDLTRTGWKYPGTSGWRSISARPSRKSWPDDCHGCRSRSRRHR
jgi:hypothetical protein